MSVVSLNASGECLSGECQCLVSVVVSGECQCLVSVSVSGESQCQCQW